MSPEWRKRIYLGLTAVIPLLVVYGLVDQEQASLWLTLATAILGTGGTLLAAANTKPSNPVDQVVEQVTRGLDSWGRG